MEATAFDSRSKTHVYRTEIRTDTEEAIHPIQGILKEVKYVFCTTPPPDVRSVDFKYTISTTFLEKYDSRRFARLA